jgi:ribosomal protein L11 methyltransferase
MYYLEVCVNTAPAAIETLAALLGDAGFENMVIEDQSELEGFLEDNKAYWDYIDEKLQSELEGLCRVRLFVENTDTEGMERLKAFIADLKENDPAGFYGSLDMTVKALPEVDWMEAWKDNYPAQPIGEKLIVVPCWNPEAGDRIPVILDPGLTFGTGAHPSTQMCMEFMEDMVTSGMEVIDLGSGSGILSIAALRLGAKTAVGVDIDPKAEDIARENAAYNDFGAERFDAVTGNVTEDHELMQSLSAKHYDLVFVNIVADVIIGLAPVLKHFMDENTRVICSGILDVREAEVHAALEAAGLRILATKSREDWRSLVAGRADA